MLTIIYSNNHYNPRNQNNTYAAQAQIKTIYRLTMQSGKFYLKIRRLSLNGFLNNLLFASCTKYAKS